MELRKNFKFKDYQIALFKAASLETTRMIAINGVVGSGKTAFAVYTALDLINKGKFDKIIYIKNCVESSHNSLGHLPGEAAEKMEVYMAPLREKIQEFTGKGDSVPVEVDHLGYIRGRTFRKSVVIIDEAQNLTREDIVLLVSRVTDDSQVWLIGDVKQKDTRITHLDKFIAAFDTEEAKQNGIFVDSWRTAEHIVRGEWLKFTLTALGEFDSEQMHQGVRVA